MSILEDFCSKHKILVSAIALAILAGAPSAHAAGMTAGNLLKEPVGERTSYIIGVTDGLAFARFRKDTLTKGERDETGMNCILGWAHEGGLGWLLEIETALEAYPEEYPITVIAALARQECGE